MKTESQSKVRIVYSSLDVKSWVLSLPSAATERPAACPCCQAAGAPVGERVTLQGHGLRYRPQTGLDVVDGEPFDDEVPVRRYRCLLCRAVVVVMPAGLLPRLRYRPVAVVLALALWVLGPGLASAAVRRRVSSTRTVAHEASRGWPSLWRWARQAWDWWGLRRPSSGYSTGQGGVETLLQRLAARARDGTGELVASAVKAAAQFNGHGVWETQEAVPTS